MRSADPLRERYDETPYRDQGFPKFDLRRLLGMARLFGLGPDPSTREDLRVLDLGCASGRHIREQAQRYAGASFTGVDFSERELQAGQQAIREAGLDNCELVCGDQTPAGPRARRAGPAIPRAALESLNNSTRS